MSGRSVTNETTVVIRANFQVTQKYIRIMQSLYLCLKSIFKLSNSSAPNATKGILANDLQTCEQRLSV